MFSRSRCFRSLSRLAVLMLVVVMLSGCTRSTKPRNHWWQLWRAKPTAAQTVYHPDTEILPPPPDVLGQGATGDAAGLPLGETLPPPPTMAQAGTILETQRPPDQAATPISDLHVIYFDFDSSELGSDAIRRLNNNAAWLKSRPNYEVSIEGHCDERGTPEYNFNLGARRAKMVRDYLITQGVEPGRLHTISYGEERPTDASGTEAAYAKNRRVQFLVY